MTLFAYFHGEGILFSFLAHCFFGLLGGGALLYGLARHPTRRGAAVAFGYVSATVALAALSQVFGGALLESIARTLTLPWNMVVPCYGLNDSSVDRVGRLGRQL